MNALFWSQLIKNQPVPFCNISKRQYDAWIGCKKKIGIEIEFLPSCEAQVKNMCRQEKGFKKASQITPEISYLFEVRDPFKFRTDVNHLWDKIYIHGLTCLGSVHVNIQYEKKSFPNDFLTAKKPVPDQKFCRLEIKAGPSAVTREEFFAKLLMAASFSPDLQIFQKRLKKLERVLQENAPSIMFGSYLAYKTKLLMYVSTIHIDMVHWNHVERTTRPRRR